MAWTFLNFLTLFQRSHDHHRHQKKEKKKKSHHKEENNRDDKKTRETKKPATISQPGSSGAIQDSKTVEAAKNLPKKLTDCGIDFGGMLPPDMSKYQDKKTRETKKPAISVSAAIAEDETVEAKLEEMFNSPTPKIQKNGGKIQVRFNEQLEIVQYDEDETVTSFQQNLQNSPNIPITNSSQSISRNFVVSDNENNVQPKKLMVAKDILNEAAIYQSISRKNILNEAAIYQSISRKNVPKLVAEDILNEAICQAFPYEKRWYCPLCARFDATEGDLSEKDVQSHIIRKHAEVQSVFFKFSAEYWASIIRGDNDPALKK